MSVPTIYVKPSSKLPDTDQWINRFNVRSERSNRLYVIAQNRLKRHWGCSCPGWRIHRTCKHLKTLALPSYERAHEVLVSNG